MTKNEAFRDAFFQEFDDLVKTGEDSMIVKAIKPVINLVRQGMTKQLDEDAAPVRDFLLDIRNRFDKVLAKYEDQPKQ
jgi:hypothetical protein